MPLSPLKEPKVIAEARHAKQREQFVSKKALMAKMRPRPFDHLGLRKAVEAMREATDRVNLDFLLSDVVWHLQISSAWKKEDVEIAALLVAEAAATWSMMAVRFSTPGKKK